jgi:8-oxo-dGTP diphosphatase
MENIRKKGVAIVETPKGILLVSKKGDKFNLPGGGAEKNETRQNATIRELKEETGLETKEIKYLFSTIGNRWHMKNGNLIRNHIKVFSVQANGIPKPGKEIKYLEFWKPQSKINVHKGAKEILERYLREKKVIYI